MDIKLGSGDGSKQVELKHIEVNINLLSLFIGIRKATSTLLIRRAANLH